MIDYSKIKVGDILKVVPPGMPGYAVVGDLVRVTEVEKEGLWCVNSKGERGGVVFSCGAARLEPTEFLNENEAQND
jgi:hypothetical protein